MFKKGNLFYADWYDVAGSRHRKSFKTEAEAREAERGGKLKKVRARVKSLQSSRPSASARQRASTRTKRQQQKRSSK